MDHLDAAVAAAAAAFDRARDAYLAARDAGVSRADAAPLVDAVGAASSAWFHAAGRAMAASNTPATRRAAAVADSGVWFWTTADRWVRRAY